MPTRTIDEHIAHLQTVEPPLTPSERAALLAILKPHRQHVPVQSRRTAARSAGES